MNSWMLSGIIMLANFGLCSDLTAQSMQITCEREELKRIEEQYFNTIEKKILQKLLFSQDVRVTENGRESKIWTGTIANAKKVLLKRSVLDTHKCETHTQAVLEEEGRPIIYGVRIRSNKEKIIEIESFSAREKDFAFNAKGLLETKDQQWEEILPVEQRSSRLAMIAAADDYFNLFVKTPKVSVPFAYPCDRWENGTLTTIKSSIVSNVPGTEEHDCSPKGLIAPHHKKRRFLVDEKTGVVVAYVLFASINPDFHMFKMRNGKIELIQAVIGAKSNTMGWSDEPIIQ